MHKLITIVGPTASGKTTLSIKLAKKYHGEIISADSRQVYRDMNIGTAKVGKSEMRAIPHHLIDIKSPNQKYTVQQYKRDFKKAVSQITKRGRIPFLVGGTGFYLNAVLNNLHIPEVPPNSALRKKLGKLSAAKLFSILKRLDSKRAKAIDRHNLRRLIRAIEIAKAGVVFPSPLEGEGRVRGNSLVLGIQISNNQLRRNINKRVDQMFRAGLASEVKKLIKKYGRRQIFFETIGYREIINHLDGNISLAEARKQIKKNTWHLTKHQYNWFKRLPVVWIKNQGQAERQLKKFLTSPGLGATLSDLGEGRVR